MTTLELLKVTKAVWQHTRRIAGREEPHPACNGGRPAAGDGQYTCGK